MPVSEAQRKAHQKYFAANYTQVKLSMPNKEAQALESFCKEHGYTRSGFIRKAIVEKMERECGLPINPEKAQAEQE